jgi:hypothetical protein
LDFDAIRKAEYAFYKPSVRQKAINQKEEQLRRRPLPFVTSALYQLKHYLLRIRTEVTDSRALFPNRNANASSESTIRRFVKIAVRSILNREVTLRILRKCQASILGRIVRAKGDVSGKEFDRINYLYDHSTLTALQNYDIQCLDDDWTTEQSMEPCLLSLYGEKGSSEEESVTVASDVDSVPVAEDDEEFGIASLIEARTDDQSDNNANEEIPSGDDQSDNDGDSNSDDDDQGGSSAPTTDIAARRRYVSEYKNTNKKDIGGTFVKGERETERERVRERERERGERE